MKEKIFALENKLIHKDMMISIMKKELEKYFYESNTEYREIYIADPDKKNLEMYNELCLSKEFYEKVCKMLNNEKGISAKYLNTIKVISNNTGFRRKG